MFSTRRWNNSTPIADQGERQFDAISLLEGGFQVKAFPNRLKRELFDCVAFSTDFNKANISCHLLSVRSSCARWCLDFDESVEMGSCAATLDGVLEGDMRRVEVGRSFSRVGWIQREDCGSGE